METRLDDDSELVTIIPVKYDFLHYKGVRDSAGVVGASPDHPGRMAIVVGRGGAETRPYGSDYRLWPPSIVTTLDCVKPPYSVPPEYVPSVYRPPTDVPVALPPRLSV